MITIQVVNLSPSSHKLSNVLVYVFTYFAYAFSSRALQNSFLCLEWQKMRFFSAPLVGNLNGEGIDLYWYNGFEVTYKEIMIIFIIYGTHMSNCRTRASLMMFFARRTYKNKHIAFMTTFSQNKNISEHVSLLGLI